MTRTLPADVRKMQLLKAARRVLRKKGFSLTRVSDIVKEAGVSQGSYYLHFQSKEDIVVELGRSMISEAMAEVQRICRPTDDDMETSLTNIVTAYYRTCLQYKDVMESASGGGAAGLNVAKWNEIYEPLNDYALDLIDIWRERGELSQNVDPNIASWLLIDTVNGAMSRLLGRSGNRVSQDYESHIIRWTLAALRCYR